MLGAQILRAWFTPDPETGAQPRINMGVVLLCPDTELMDDIVNEVSTDRKLENRGNGVIGPSIFNNLWIQSWTPEEHVLTRALHTKRPNLNWTYISAKFNFEVRETFLGFPKVPYQYIRKKPGLLVYCTSLVLGNHHIGPGILRGANIQKIRFISI